MKRELQRVIEREDDLKYAERWLEGMVPQWLLSGPVRLSIGRPRRSLDQNARLWAMLTDVSRQVVWYGQTLTPEDWKSVFTAALKRYRTVPGIDGGFVVLGMSTSSMDKETFSELIELIYAFGADHGVDWSEPEERKVS